MFEIKRYTKEQENEWNMFMAQSKNGTFLFDRQYMDYHSNRFDDHSLMVYRSGKLYALLPGNVADETFYSHQGLTFGGLVMNEKATTVDVINVFNLINNSLRSDGLRRVVYKPSPWIFHRQPSEEDLYAIIKTCGARLCARELSSTISRDHYNKWYHIRKDGAKKAKGLGVTITESDDFQSFWHILTENLKKRYGVAPVHTIEEIQLLKQRFPNNKRLVIAKEGENIDGGTVLYVYDRVIHSQYISANDRGRDIHAIDLLFETVIRDSLTTHPYFDFGISTEKHGTFLNEKLLYQKEGFGARAVCFDTYEYNL
ncbi:MAG: GNAT family N-acetyltransferase [Prevotella sp.]|nr:GNAT family N-acetyltransferase [Prevotella sp.]